MTNLSPAAAGFDGEKGFCMPMHGENFRISLRRGKVRPVDHPDADFSEQLVWFYPENQDAKLLWCNADDQWFELRFNPIDKP